jgi:hypothetical protein
LRTFFLFWCVEALPYATSLEWQEWNLSIF